MDSSDVNFLRRYEKSRYLSVGEQGHSVRKIQSQLLKGICDTLLVSEPDSVKLHFRQLFAVQNENADYISVFIPEAVPDIKSVMCLSELPPDRQDEVKRQVAYDFSYLAARARKLIATRPKPDKMIFLRFFYNSDFAGGLGAFLHLPDSDDCIFIVNGRIPVVALYGYRINPYRRIGGGSAEAADGVPEAETDQDWRFHHPLDSFVPDNGEDGGYRSLNYDWSDRVTAEHLISENTVPGSRFPDPAADAPENGSGGEVLAAAVPVSEYAPAPETAGTAESDSYAPGENSFHGVPDAVPESGSDHPATGETGNSNGGEESSVPGSDKTVIPPFVKWLTVFVLACLLILLLTVMLWYVSHPGKPLYEMLPWYREAPVLNGKPGSRDPETPAVLPGEAEGVPIPVMPETGSATGHYTGDAVIAPDSPDTGNSEARNGESSGTAEGGNSAPGSQDPSLYNPEFDTGKGGAAPGGDDDSLEPNAGNTGISGDTGGTPADPDSAGSSPGTGEFRENLGGSGSGSLTEEPGGTENPGSYLKISYRDLGPLEEGGRRVAYTVTDENNSVRCSLRGRFSRIDNGRVFFIDENIKIGNGCDLSSFPKEMLCYDSDGSFCRAIPRNNGQKGFVQYVKLSKE